MKKILLSLGSLTAVAAPVAAVISCGSSTESANGAQSGTDQTPTINVDLGHGQVDQWLTLGAVDQWKEGKKVPFPQALLDYVTLVDGAFTLQDLSKIPAYLQVEAARFMILQGKFANAKTIEEAQDIWNKLYDSFKEITRIADAQITDISEFFQNNVALPIPGVLKNLGHHIIKDQEGRYEVEADYIPTPFELSLTPLVTSYLRSRENYYSSKNLAEAKQNFMNLVDIHKALTEQVDLLIKHDSQIHPGAHGYAY